MPYQKLDIAGYQYGMDGYVYSNLKRIKDRAIRNNWDAFIIVWGKEGTGKSTYAAQTGLFLDPNMTLDNWAWTAEQFEDKIMNAAPESAVVWDEAITGANAAQWASAVSQTVINLLTQIRKKRLKIIICFPYLNMLNKYFVSRCIASVWVYARSFTDRGYARFYNQKQTEFAYGLVKEKYRLRPFEGIKNANYAFSFRYGKTMPVPRDEYEQLKDAGIKAAKSQKTDIWKDHFINLVRAVRDRCADKKDISIAKLAKDIGLSSVYIYKTAKGT